MKNPVNPVPPGGMRRWHFSLVLLVAYVAVFHFWLGRERGLVLASAALTVTALTVYGVRVARSSYFRNRWDQLFHAAVLLDILLEGWLIRRHEDHGFYLCALAFVLVVGGYHGPRPRADAAPTPADADVGK